MNYTDNADVFLEVERQLQETRDFCHSMTIKMPTFAGEGMRLMQHLDQDLRRLKFLTANQTNIATSVAGTSASNPLVHQIFNNPDKNIMGKRVGSDRQPVLPKALVPTKTAQSKFAAQVNDLYRGFPGLSNQDVSNILSKPGGATLIRGVAKIADVPDWDVRDATELNFGFFDTIREAIAVKETGSNLIKSLETKVAAEDEVEIAEEVIDEPAPGARKPAKKNKSQGNGAANPLVNTILDEE